MNSFQGIPISETGLLVETILFAVMLILLLAAIIAYAVISLSMKNPKARRRIKNLRERAEHDESARKQIEKLEAKNKRRRHRNRDTIVSDVLVFSLGLGLSALILFLGIIPGWTDYSEKDYAVYTGEITVVRAGRHSHIVLGDGTAVHGVGIFDVEDTHGTVVYSKRSCYYLGGEK